MELTSRSEVRKIEKTFYNSSGSIRSIHIRIKRTKYGLYNTTKGEAFG